MCQNSVTNSATSQELKFVAYGAVYFQLPIIGLHIVVIGNCVNIVLSLCVSADCDKNLQSL